MSHIDQLFDHDIIAQSKINLVRAILKRFLATQLKLKTSLIGFLDETLRNKQRRMCHQPMREQSRLNSCERKCSLRWSLTRKLSQIWSYFESNTCIFRYRTGKERKRFCYVFHNGVHTLLMHHHLILIYVLCSSISHVAITFIIFPISRFSPPMTGTFSDSMYVSPL